jgi:hypothetical protein
MSAPGTGLIPPTVSPEERKHILDFHISLSIQENTLVVTVSKECSKQPCPVPEGVVLFSCHRPPCPLIVVLPPPPTPDPAKR